MKIALVQHDVCFEDAQATCRRLAPLVRTAVTGGAELVVLTEMFATGFSMTTNIVAESEGKGEGQDFLQELATETGVAMSGSLPVLPEGARQPFNRFVCVLPAGEKVQYDKIHPFAFGHEHENYGAGPGIETFRWRGLAITPQICYDLRFADAFWAVAERTDCYVVVSNWPAARAGHFRALAIARAIENQAYVLATNRVGTGGELPYGGGTIAVGPFGEVLAEAGEDEAVLLVDVTAQRVAEVRAGFPFLPDRRPFSVQPVRELGD